jgi:plasmid stabilization system protein ParE
LPGGKYKVRWLKKALENIEAEAEYIAQESPAAAAAVVARIREAVEHPRALSVLWTSGARSRDPGARDSRHAVHRAVSSQGKDGGNPARVPCIPAMAKEFLTIHRADFDHGSFANDGRQGRGQRLSMIDGCRQ